MSFRGLRRCHLRVWLVVAAGLLVLSACSSSDDGANTSSTRADSAGPTSVATDPPPSPGPATETTPLPPAASDCGSLSALAGWPTTTQAFPDRFTCIVDALTAGTPARMVMTSAGEGDSGRRTPDGYEIPTSVVTTWLVTGPGELQQTIDRSEDGVGVTTETCEGIDVQLNGATATGCTE